MFSWTYRKNGISSPLKKLHFWGFYNFSGLFPLLLSIATMHSQEIRKAALDLLEDNTQSYVAKKTGVSERTLRRWLTCWRTEGNIAPRPRPGRPRSTTEREDRIILRAALKDRRASLRSLTHEVQDRISHVTVRKRLAEQGYRRTKPRGKNNLAEVKHAGSHSRTRKPSEA